MLNSHATNSWGFLRHNCVTQEAQLLAILIEGCCWARLGFCKARPRLAGCRQLPQGLRLPAPSRPRAPAKAKAAQTQKRTDPLRAHVTAGEAGGGRATVFLSPPPQAPPSPEKLRLLRHYRNDRHPSQSGRDSSSATRPLLVFRFLPARRGVTSEEREPP